VAPEGSLAGDARVHQIAGALQSSSQNDGRDAAISMPPSPVLGAMWEWIRDHRADHDVVVNLAYDWLPFHITPYLTVPVVHLVSMASVNDAMDDAISRLVRARPGSVAVHSAAQAATFPAIADRLLVIGNGIAVARYDVRLTAEEPPYLGHVGRISPEKGIADVFGVSAATGLPVRAWGLMQDQACWDAAVAAHPTAQVTHQGFLPTDELQAAIGGCAAILMTPRWVEAFGNVAIEALACGVPVVAYRRGGPAEIVEDGRNGYLVEPDDVEAMADAVSRIDQIDRQMCRRSVETRWSTEAMAERVEGWLADEIGRWGSVASEPSLR
jgi:UDP-glucose:tetrahydrobiopterin glucosyltransferase